MAGPRCSSRIRSNGGSWYGRVLGCANGLSGGRPGRAPERSGVGVLTVPHPRYGPQPARTAAGRPKSQP
jgi:hypothetical protein